MRPMPPNTQYTAYGKSFIFIGGHGRSSSSATAGGAGGGGLGIATGSEGAAIREERGSGEEGGAPADIGGQEGGAPAALPESIEGAARSRSRSARAEMWSGIEIRMREAKTLGIDCSGAKFTAGTFFSRVISVVSKLTMIPILRLSSDGP